MTKELTEALKNAIEKIRSDYREAKERYDELDSKLYESLSFEEAELHDYYDGFSTGLYTSLHHLEKYLAVAGFTGLVVKI